MFRLTLIIAVLATAAGGASAAPRVLAQLEGTYELALVDVQGPEAASGFVRLYTCPSCASRTHRVDAATRYILGGRELPFDEFSSYLAGMRASESTARNVLVGIFYDLESSVVTRIVVHEHRN